MQIIKNVKAEQHCSLCNKELHSQMIIMAVTPDFKISELSLHVLDSLDKKYCKKHPEAPVSVTHIHHHKEKLS